jgi:hypothetical protein
MMVLTVPAIDMARLMVVASGALGASCTMYERRRKRVLGVVSPAEGLDSPGGRGLRPWRRPLGESYVVCSGGAGGR